MVRAVYVENIVKLVEIVFRLKVIFYLYIWIFCLTGIFNLGFYIYIFKFFYEIYKGIFLFLKIEYFYNFDAL